MKKMWPAEEGSLKGKRNIIQRHFLLKQKLVLFAVKQNKQINSVIYSWITVDFVIQKYFC